MAPRFQVLYWKNSSVGRQSETGRQIKRARLRQSQKLENKSHEHTRKGLECLSQKEGSRDTKYTRKGKTMRHRCNKLGAGQKNPSGGKYTRAGSGALKPEQKGR